MRVISQPKEYTPVSIVLETEREAEAMLYLLHMVTNRDEPEKIGWIAPHPIEHFIFGAALKDKLKELIK